jgi:DNA replication protein DnaC
MNTPIERLQTALETLGLKAVEQRLENLLEQASKKEPSYADFLDELLSCEVEARRTRYLRATAVGAFSVRENLRAVRFRFSTLAG